MRRNERKNQSPKKEEVPMSPASMPENNDVKTHSVCL